MKRLSAQLSRRQFLASATAATGGLVLPAFLPSHVLAAAGQPGANDRIGIAFIGMGRQAHALLESIERLPEARVVGVADANLVRAREVAQKHNCVAVQDYRKVLDLKDVDAVMTATPEQWRGPICIHACQAGKDVYAEKPMSLTIREGRLIVAATRKYNRVFQTGSQQRSMVRNHIGCEFIRKGGLGKIRRVIAHNYPSPWEYALPEQKVPDELDWDMWCGPGPKVAYNQDLYLPRANPGWLSFRPFSGGEMTGWGSHGFDQVQWALGVDESGPIEVWTEGQTWNPPTYTKAEPKTRGDELCKQTKVFVRYPGDIVMELGNGPDGGAIFIGEKGSVTINRGVCESDPEELLVETIRNRPQNFDQNHQKDWLNCIKSRSRPRADVETGHRSATVCHLGNIARIIGRRLRWDPVKEIFPDDAAANQLLDRQRRRPWTLPDAV